MKERKRKMIVRLLGLPGLKGDLAVEIVRLFSNFKRMLAVVFVLTLITPTMELGFIGSLYVLLSSEKQQQVLNVVRDFGVCDFVPYLCDASHVIHWTSAFAGVLLIVYVGTRLLHSYCLAKLNYETYVMYSSRLLSAYLNMPPMRVLGLDRTKVANAIVLEVAMFGAQATELLLLLTAIGTALLFLVGAASLSILLLAVSAGVGFAMFAINRYGYRRARRIGEKRIAAVNYMLGRTYDILEGFRAIKLEGAEQRILRSERQIIKAQQRWRYESKWNVLSVNNFSQGFTYVVLFVVVFFAVVVMQLNVAMMLTFMVVMARLQRVFLTAQTHWMKIKQNIAGLEMVQDILSYCEACHLPTEAGDDNTAVCDEPYTIRFEKVGFRYQDNPWIYKGLSMTLEAGDRVLIQGQSGQGKSTLLLLLLGLIEPTTGAIYYNGSHLDPSLFREVRNHTAYAAPDLHLFRDSIRANLALAGEFDDSQMQEAIRKARLEEVIANISGGVDGFIGENGSQLSLGERQRVMLARIFLKKPKLLVLDEATSNLDVGLEDEILKDLLSGLDEDAILVLIAHKKPANVRFDRVLILEGGELQEYSNGVDPGEAALTSECL